jgi:hypothetical protein
VDNLTTTRILRLLILCAILTACGGGGGGGGPTAVAPAPATPVAPAQPGLYLLAGDGRELSADGVGAAASFRYPTALAADGAGNVYVLEYLNLGPAVPSPPRLRKIAPDGAVTTLIGSGDGAGTWFGQPDTNRNIDRLYRSRGLAADRAGNLYISIGVGSGEYNEVPGVRAAILKITPSGALTLLAGTEDNLNTRAIADGAGSAARFLFPTIVGIDVDDNLYVLDTDRLSPMPGTPVVTPRKVTPAGVVTTLAALPANLNADMNGNTYRYDGATQALVRTTPEGVTSLEAKALFCSDYSVGEGPCVSNIIPTGGASYVLISGARIVRLVVRH